MQITTTTARLTYFGKAVLSTIKPDTTDPHTTGPYKSVILPGQIRIILIVQASLLLAFCRSIYPARQGVPFK